jgi:hypothetical protein
MISKIKTVASRGNVPLYQLKVVLLDSKPPIWRRLQVPGDASLAWLHAVLQLAMGWNNSHLHQFRVGEARYAKKRRRSAQCEGAPEILEERDFTLQQIAPHEQDAFSYEYDSGDSWKHEITVEKILLPDAPAATTATCLDGARACPPEDCGGIGGYENLLQILKNLNHPEHQNIQKWLGYEFEAEAFDASNITLWLRELKWPRVTDAQLATALMGRDGCYE